MINSEQMSKGIALCEQKGLTFLASIFSDEVIIQDGTTDVFTGMFDEAVAWLADTKPSRVLTFYSDPGHGWLAVLKTDLETLGIADKISPFSYQKGLYAYLEEDCDASIFEGAAKDAGWSVEVKEDFREYTPIRQYDRYSA